ncbi:MAG: flagellin N-terminal helical domain-containing protein [Actinomycetes bacterium]
MGLYLTSNVAAMNAYQNLSVTQNQLQVSIQQLSSGYRINSAANDPSGLAISQGLQAQIGGLTQAVQNAQNGISVAQTAEGALNETQAILQRMNTLAVESANGGSMSTQAQQAAQTEFSQLQTQLNQIASSTNFNGQSLLNGSYSGVFQIGATAATFNQSTVDMSASGIGTMMTAAGISSVTGLDASGLGVGTSVALTASGNSAASNAALAASAISAITNAINAVSTVRANLGAYQNAFQHTINNLNTAVTNLTASNAAIQDTNFASTMATFTQQQILQQAGVSVLAQANQLPSSVLKLLG